MKETSNRKTETNTPVKTAIEAPLGKLPDGKVAKDGVDVEVSVTNKSAATLENKTPDGQNASGAVTPPNTPTPTQIFETPPRPILTHEDGRDPKIVRNVQKPGAMTPNTVVEEVIMVETGAETADLDKLLPALRVKAATQGVNQSAILSGGEVLTVFQDGTHTVGKVPVSIGKDDKTA